MKNITILFLCLASFFSCTEEVNLPESELIRINTNISHLTKVSGAGFEANDEIGLYGWAWENDKNPSVTSLPYVNNVKFTNGVNGFVSEPIYFPKGNMKSNFYAYYPYSQEALPAGNTAMTFKVAEDQSVWVDHMKSDFLLAEFIGKINDGTPVMLIFKHALSKMKISLKAGMGFTGDSEIQGAQVSITNLNSKCAVELETRGITDLSEVAAIKPYGEFVFQNDALTTVEAMLIPQLIGAGTILFEISLDGTDLEYKIGSDFKLLPGYMHEFEITLHRAAKTQSVVKMKSYPLLD